LKKLMPLLAMTPPIQARLAASKYCTIVAKASGRI